MVLRLLLAYFASEKGKDLDDESRESVKGWVGRLLMGCGVDVNSSYFLRVLNFDCASCSSTRFVSAYTFGKICFWSLEGRHRGLVITFCQSGC